MRIVQIVHGFPPSGAGGTELYVEALSQTFAAAGHEMLVIAREAAPRAREYAVRAKRRGAVEVTFVNNTFSRCTTFEDSYRNPRLARIVRDLALGFRPDVVHIHHLTCLSSDIPGELSAAGIPMVMTLHDYWLMCHRGQLLDREHRLCAGPGEAGCASCIGVAGSAGTAAHLAARGARILGSLAPRLAGTAARFGRRWLSSHAPADAGRSASLVRTAQMREAAMHVSLFLAPSEYVRQRFIGFGIAPDRIVRHEQGIDTSSFERRTTAEGPLRIGFFGSLVVSKGPEVLLDAFRRLQAGSAVLRVFGDPAPYHDDPDSGHRLRQLLQTPGVEHVGPIPREQVPAALRELDVVALPSIWPENAPFVLREAHAAGIPVVASRIGGVTEAVIDGRNGLLFQPGDAADCARALQRFVEDRALLARLSPVGNVRTLEEDARITLDLYRRACACAVSPSRTPTGVSSAAPNTLAAVVLDYHTPDETLLAVRSLLASDRPPDEIIVVDNDSTDDGAALRRRLPSVSVLPLAGNRGFSGGVNAGIRRALDAGADLVLLINSDVVAAPDALGTLERGLDRAGAGVAGPALVSRSEPGTVSSLGMSWSPATGRMRHAGFGRPTGELTTATTRVMDGVSGCAMLVRRDVFNRSGYFDEEYFFGFEDLEFCLRSRAAGFKTVCCPEALMYHEGGRSIGPRSPQRVYFATRNHLKLAAVAGGNWWTRSVRAAAVLGFNGAYVLRSPDVRLLPGLMAFLRGARDHLAGRYGPG